MAKPTAEEELFTEEDDQLQNLEENSPADEAKLIEETVGNSNSNIVYHQWDPAEIALAQTIAADREKSRTQVDNELDLVAYLNNKETWYSAGSRFLLFMGATWGVAGIVVLLIASGEEAKTNGLTLWEFMKVEGSVSSLYQTDANGTSASTQLFQAFLTAASILIIISNFGFYVLPRWENQTTLSKMDGNVGEISHQTLKYFCICRANYKRIEATSNWVTSEEGLFKMAFNMFAGIVVLLIGSVPLPPANARSKIQTMVHLLVAMLAFAVMAICELYQIFRGERILSRCTGVIQIGRVGLILIAAIGMGVYMFCREAEVNSTKRGMAALWETIGFLAMFVDLMLICCIPIKAEQSVFALSGDKWLKEHGRHDSVKINLMKFE